MPIPRDDVSGNTSQQLVAFSPDAQEYALPNTAVHESNLSLRRQAAERRLSAPMAGTTTTQARCVVVVDGVLPVDQLATAVAKELA